MTPTEEARLLALLRGEPVGAKCGDCDPEWGWAPRGKCPVCHGTGRIHTEPEGVVEKRAAWLWAHAATLQGERDEHVRASGALRQDNDRLTCENAELRAHNVAMTERGNIYEREATAGQALADFLYRMSDERADVRDALATYDAAVKGEKE